MSPSQRLVLTQFALFAALGLAVVLTPVQSPPIAQIVGVVSGIAGVALVVVAISTHKTPPKIFPDPNRKAPLVTTGLYARMRHPIYSGVLLSAFGISLLHGGSIVWVIMAAMYIFFYAKSRYEEALLLHVYPEYKDYMMRTGRFLPR